MTVRARFCVFLWKRRGRSKNELGEGVKLMVVYADFVCVHSRRRESSMHNFNPLYISDLLYSILTFLRQANF